MTKPKPNQYTKETGRNIRHVRRAKEISLVALGKAVGRHEKTIGRYERGIINPPTEVLDKIAEFMGVSINRLLPNNNKK